MTTNGKTDRNGNAVVSLSRADYYKLAGLFLAFAALVMTATVGLSNIVHHISDDEKHMTRLQKREQIEAIVGPVVQQALDYGIGQLRIHESKPHAADPIESEQIYELERRVYALEAQK